jgi:hypothetical protein
VSTQLELEKLITTSRVGWCKYLAERHDTDETVGSGFALVLAYANALHATTIAETGRWGETIMTELAKFQKSIEAKQSTPAKE